MKITAITPIVARFGNRPRVLVKVETDEGITGHGEVCPLGPVYLPAYAEGARAGIQVLAPALIGEDHTQLAKLNRHMDATLKGHPYVKSALDMACWDILGQATGQAAPLFPGVGCPAARGPAASRRCAERAA